MTPSVNPHGRPLIGRPTTSSTGHLADAFESSSRFEGASEMASNTIILMDRIPLACMIVSLGCLLIDRSLGGAIDSVYGEREAIAGRRATACDNAAYLGGSAVTKLQRATEPLQLRMPQDPLRPSTCGTMTMVDRVPFRMGRTRRPLSKVIGRPLTA